MISISMLRYQCSILVDIAIIDSELDRLRYIIRVENGSTALRVSVQDIYTSYRGDIMPNED